MNAAVIRATRASASALAAMAIHKREIMHADKTMAWNASMVERGLMSVHHMDLDNAICMSGKNRAMLALARARGRYERANLILEREKLPGD
jgi:hypothetical protein